MSELTDSILRLSHLRSPHIAKELNCSARYVRRVLKAHGLNHPNGPPPGEDNPAWVGGRMVSMSGYVLLKNKPTEKLYEHWQVIEEHRGYERQPGEVCDHIDGITIHNSIENLRTFASNGKHLKATLTGRKKQISRSGRLNIGLKWYPVANRVPVDTFEKRRARGDVRLRAILRASLELGIEHPCLLGTTHWLEKAGIDPASRPNLERAWADLLSRYEQDLAQ